MRKQFEAFRERGQFFLTKKMKIVILLSLENKILSSECNVFRKKQTFFSRGAEKLRI